MTRDDSSGGWVPLNGGGLSYVCLKTIPTVSNGSGCSGREVDLRKDYIIYGERIVDANVSINLPFFLFHFLSVSIHDVINLCKATGIEKLTLQAYGFGFSQPVHSLC